MLRFLSILGCVLGLVASTARAESNSHGAVLPPGAHEVGIDRFQTGEPFAETLKFYARIYSPERFPRRSIADLPGVRAVHLMNPGHGGWTGLNIYELNGVTRIFVVARSAHPAKNSFR